MRLGIGSRPDAGPGQATLQLHAPPVVPDTNYTTWSYTNVSPGPWAELVFQYGGDRVMMTSAIAAYNITSGGWRELQDQLGIDRAFITLNLPELLGHWGTVAWNVGVFSNRYGAPGKYDAGAYETYVIGRTRGAGETFVAELDAGHELKVLVEHGIGAKLDQQAWTARAVGMPISYESFEPYPGPVQQGTTLLHHGHLGVNYSGLLSATVHYLRAWTQDARATGMGPDGSMRVLGADLRLDGKWMGYGYLGYSSAKAVNVNVLNDALELIHSQGGWQFSNNYLNKTGDGTVNTLGLQYTFSVAAFLTRPKPWWGNGTDVTVSVFGMYNTISTPDPSVIETTGRRKLKFGLESLYTPLSFLSVGGRADVVQPNLDNAHRSFYVITPRIVLRTKFVTNEMIVLQYAAYIYKDETALPYPFEGPGATRPAMGMRDKGVLGLYASMWW